ncbi:hypothetical protein OS493_038701 [Desmophyllum pertusum]|uniref:Uncharacterized protein n=1 Tax=Desmophyllum pertusum TaxID=174260 RepID=A0A9W9YHD6_9CNID|nr:hypothetical protein OS493_038701 [Desmophyllum pertusum]
MFKAILVEKVNDFLDSDSYVSRIGTTAIGKTNSSFVEENVFVLSEKVHVDQRGNLLGQEDHKFVYVPGRNELELRVKRPFSVKPLKAILPIAKTALKQNYGAMLLALGCVAMDSCALGSEFVEWGAREITEGYISRVARHLEGAMSDVVPSYAIVMWFVKEAVGQVISTGRTKNVPCVVIQPSFYQNTDYDSSAVHASLRKENKGKSQCRKVKGKNVRATYVHQTAFGENLGNVLRALRNNEERIASNEESSTSDEEESKGGEQERDDEESSASDEESSTNDEEESRGGEQEREGEQGRGDEESSSSDEESSGDQQGREGEQSRSSEQEREGEQGRGDEQEREGEQRSGGEQEREGEQHSGGEREREGEQGRG